MSQQRESLLQYQPPTEVFAQESMGGSRQKNAQQMFDSKLAIDCTILLILELLTSMFPPVSYETEGKNYKKVISTNPPSREDVNTLQKMLDEKLVYRQARFNFV
jgi:dynein light intermediate chain